MRRMWTILQVLTGKLFETWNLIAERFPEDSGITGLSEAHKKSLDWLRDYFGTSKVQGKKRTPLRTLRDKTAFHYDKLNLDQAVNDVSQPECRVYIAEHPANAVYYAWSALIFRTVFAMIADQAMDTKAMSGIDRMAAGVRIALATGPGEWKADRRDRAIAHPRGGCAETHNGGIADVHRRWTGGDRTDRTMKGPEI
jgi:hypothetical protein